MAKFKQRAEAIKLRTEGKSIKHIASSLMVSQSTVSVWCRDISLTQKAIEAIAKNGNEKSIIGLMRYSEKKRNERQKVERTKKSEGKERLGLLSPRDIYCIGLGLYWGEGYKSGSQEFGFTNSDPRMIIFYIHWLETVFNINKERLILRISINELHKKRVREVEMYWQTLLGVSNNQFTKSSLIKTTSKKIYANSSSHMGTLRVKVRKGTNFRREILGAIEAII